MIYFLVQAYFPGPRSLWSKKKTLQAHDLLGSFAADTDLLLDWWFLADVYTNENIDHVPVPLKRTHLAFTILGTIAWFALASDGRAVDWFLVKPILFLNCIWFTCFGKSGCCAQGKCLACGIVWEETKKADVLDLAGLKISTGFLLFCGILLEDLPQVLLSFAIQEYLEMTDEELAEGSVKPFALSGIAVANLMTSVYNALIKVADAYDQREDVVLVSVSPDKRDISKEFKRELSHVIPY